MEGISEEQQYNDTTFGKFSKYDDEYSSSSDEDDDDDKLNKISEAETCRSKEISLLSSEGYVTSDCVMKLDLKYHPEYSGTYLVQASIVVLDTKNNITTSATNDNDNEIGYLEGELIKRPHPMFREVGKGISNEVQELCTLFFNERGEIDTKKSVISKHEQVSNNAAIQAEGGFFHIDKVEIREDQRGNDLGLKLITETFNFLGDDWNIAIMRPKPLSLRFQRWKKPSQQQEEEAGSFGQEEESYDTNRLKIQQHFARMGFQQVAKTPALFHTFFVTSDYTIPKWVPKSKIKTSNSIYVPPKKHVPNELDLKLQNLITNAPSNETVYQSMVHLIAEENGADEESTSETVADLAGSITAKNSSTCTAPKGVEQMRNAFRRASGLKTTVQSMKELIDQGASIEGARAMHVAASKSQTCGTGILNALMHFGANVNSVDEYGNTPLHYAAQSMSVQGIQLLLEYGADKQICNLSNESPIQFFENILRGTKTNDNVKLHAQIRTLLY